MFPANQLKTEFAAATPRREFSPKRPDTSEPVALDEVIFMTGSRTGSSTTSSKKTPPRKKTHKRPAHPQSEKPPRKVLRLSLTTSLSRTMSAPQPGKE